MNKIKLAFLVLPVLFRTFLSIMKDPSFLNYQKGSTGKFKLFGKQYIKEQRREKNPSRPKSKTVTFVTALSKVFDPRFKEQETEENFFNLIKFTTLWYLSHQIQTKETHETTNNNQSESHQS